MKKKIIIIICVIAVLIVGIVFYFNRNGNVEEYIPEEEISEEDSKMTTIILYFQNKETKELETEIRNISSKDLLLEPYKNILQLLMEGPQNENLEKTIPEGVILNSVSIENYCLKIDFSRQFIENCSEDEKIRKNIIESINNTLTQLNEVSSIKILIDGIENLGFPNSEIKF
ncbi:MAG: GerMN domain-containing protein [Candidatus Scatovivens sp.]